MSVQETTRFDRFKAKARDLYNTPAVRFSLALTGCCIAAYAGGRHTMANVEKNTKSIDTHMKNAVDFMLAEANLRESRAAEDRSIIGAMTEDNEPFVFYPGLGVLDLNQFTEQKKPKKAS